MRSTMLLCLALTGAVAVLGSCGGGEETATTEAMSEGTKERARDMIRALRTDVECMSGDYSVGTPRPTECDNTATTMAFACDMLREDIPTPEGKQYGEMTLELRAFCDEHYSIIFGFFPDVVLKEKLAALADDIEEFIRE